jgi:hypothetical protein
MTSLLLALVLIVIGILPAVTGLPWISVPLFVIAVIAFIWGAIVFLRGDDRTSLRHPRKAELLGPGGPDDPDAGA